MNDSEETGADMAALLERNAALERELGEVRQAQVLAELKAEAIRAGMVDLDGLKLLPADSIRIDETGGIHGAKGAIAQLRRDKPWLFTQSNSSSTSPAPPTTPAAPRLATEMGFDEWRTARAELLRRR